jgi:YD repeat-containing protein
LHFQQAIVDTMGNRKVMTDSLGVTRYVYDELNRLKQVIDPFMGTVQYRYDVVGNRTQTIYPDGKVVTTTFDAANRLTGTLNWDGQLTTYQFDKAGRLITTTLPNVVRSVNGYDDAGRLVNLTHMGPYWTLAAYTYTLDAMGNRLAVIERVLPPTPFVYLPVILKDFDRGGEQMLPGEAAAYLKVAEADVMAMIAGSQVKAKQMGTSYGLGIMGSTMYDA